MEIAFTETMDSKRRAVYFQHLSPIPNDLWDAGVLRLADQVRFPRLPLIAEIGEACVPGETETEETDPWTGRWKKVQTPWKERLSNLWDPVLLATPAQPQLPDPRDPLSEAEQKLLGRLDFAGLLQTLKEKVEVSKERRLAARKVDESASPFILAKNSKNLLDVNTEESQAVAEYWTPERMEQRREFLHRQLAWLSRRDAAERAGQGFSETRPQEE
jgi:hypothetical protein